MTEKVHHDLLAEIKKLNSRLDRANTAPRISRHGWLKIFFKDLETNPQTQASIHKWACVYWLCNFPVVLSLFFFAPHVWLAIGLLVNTVYSLYANLATDYGALSGAESYAEARKASGAAQVIAGVDAEQVDPAL